MINLEKLKEEYARISEQLSQEDITRNRDRYAEITKRFSYLEKLISFSKQRNSFLKEKENLLAMLSDTAEDKEMQDLAREELLIVEKNINIIDEKIEDKIFEEDDSDRDIIIEIRAAAGGDESGLFAATLFKMYSKFIEIKNWKPEVLSSNDTEIGGYKEIIFSGTNNLLNGEGILGILPSNFEGTSPPYRIEPEFENKKFYLQSYVPKNPVRGNQLYYLRFIKTKHLKKYHYSSYDSAQIDNIGPKAIHIKLYPYYDLKIDEYFGFYYSFNSKLNILDVIPSAGLRQMYPIYKQNNDIKISFEELVTISKNNVLKWHNGKWSPLSEVID